MRPDRTSIVLVGFLVEGLLVLIFAIWAHFRNFHDQLYPSGQHILLGILGALLLCVVNYVTFKVIGYRCRYLHSSLVFIDTVVKPLADQLGLVSGLIVSICAGVGEEVFFRGMIQTEFGLVVASILFSFLHFGRAVKDYAQVAFIYAVIGMYFGIIYELSDTLWVGIILHAAYDYFALLYFRYGYKSALPPSKTTIAPAK